MEGGIQIHLAPEELFSLWGIPVTNTLITAIFVAILLSIIAYFVGRNLKMVPSKIQLFFEAVIGVTMSYMDDVLENKALSRKYLPLVLTLFLFIMTVNLLGLFPGVGSVGIWDTHGDYPKLLSFLYPSATDLNFTLALTIVAFIAIEIAGVTTIGFLKYAHKFVTFKSAIGFFVGIIELISEIARLITYSFRLFGNIFAGKVLILIATFFVPLVLPVPLMLYEVFVGIIQAIVFAVLTVVFIKIAVTDAEAH